MKNIYLNQEKYYEPINRICRKYGIPFVYDWTFSLHNNMNYLIKVVNGMVIEMWELQELIKEFIRMFDKDLQDTVIKTLEKWQEEGKLEGIINEALFNQKLDKSVFEEFKEKDNEYKNKIDKEIIDFKNDQDIKHKEIDNEIKSLGDYAYFNKTIVNLKDSDKIIQEKISKGGNVIFERGEYDVSFNSKRGEYDIVFDINSNTNLNLNGSTFRLKDHNTKHYAIFNIENKENITITNATLDGNRKGNSVEGGEWGMGIMVKGSTNIDLMNLNINNCWGDGIYIGSGIKNHSSNITFKNIVCDNNRRQGISVISVDGLLGENVVLSNTNGTSPEAGIDFEPNKDGELLKNILFNNLSVINNKGNGIFTHALPLKTNPEVSMIFNNTYVKGNNRGVAFQMLNTGGKGHVIFNGLTIEDTKQNAIWFNAFSTETAPITLTNVKTINCQIEGKQNDEQGNIIQFTNTKYSEEHSVSMNDIVLDGYVDNNSNNAYSKIGFIQYVGKPYQNITINTKETSIFEGRQLENSYIRAGSYQYFPGTSPVSITFPSRRIYTNIVNGIGEKNIIINLPKVTNNNGGEFTYTHRNERTNVWTDIVPEGSHEFFPSKYARGIRCGNKDAFGETVTFKVVNNRWTITQISDGWTAK